MTTLLQQRAPPTTAATRTATSAASAAASAAAMAWSNEKLRFSCVDNIGLRQIWKLIALDTTSTNTNVKNNSNHHNSNVHNHASNNNNNNNVNNLQRQKQQQHSNSNNNEQMQHHIENCENLAEYLTNRDISTPNHMSLLTFFAINALELSAPATPALLQHNQVTSQNCKPQGWMQLSGHPESIVPTTTGIVRKRVASLTDNEVQAYKFISHESQTAKIVPQFFGAQQLNGEHFIELQDLLAGFKDPCVMDIKMGCRTFLESEVTNETLRSDLYKKMIAVDATAPTPEEHQAQAITKLRYMLFREAMSSSHSKGFRIEALRLRGRAPVTDLKTVRSSEQIEKTIEKFMGTKKTMHKDLIKRLKHMRQVIEKSQFFQRHEIVGSSIFIVYDDDKVGAWLIDFAKSRQLPTELTVSHRADWVPGNREEGLLTGMDELINSFECVHARNGGNGRKCLQI